MERWRLNEAELDALPAAVRDDMLLVMEGEREAERMAEQADKMRRR